MASTANMILVDPERLEQTANTFENQKKVVQNRVNTMMQNVNNLSGKWEGEASTAYRTKFNKLQGDIAQMMNMIQDYINDLRAVAKLYKSVETTSTSKVQQLGDDVIH